MADVKTVEHDGDVDAFLAAAGVSGSTVRALRTWRGSLGEACLDAR